jgi:hypothetical protein
VKFSDLRPLVTLSAYVLSLVTLTMSAPEEPVFPRHEHCGSFAELHEWVLTTPCRLWRPLPNEAGLYGAVVLDLEDLRSEVAARVPPVGARFLHPTKSDNPAGRRYLRLVVSCAAADYSAVQQAELKRLRELGVSGVQAARPPETWWATYDTVQVAQPDPTPAILIAGATTRLSRGLAAYADRSDDLVVQLNAMKGDVELLLRALR